jgi:hypothetical protein
MLSVVSICPDQEKTDAFSRKLIKLDQTIWWGLHVWQETYIPSGFTDSIRDDGDSYQHWLDVLAEHDLQEVIEEIEI